MPFRLMLVDDDAAVLDVVQSIVQDLDCEILAYTDSREAAESISRQKLHAAFVDLRMPHIDGLELTRRIRRSPSNSKIPVVMITGQGDANTLREGFAAGVSFFLNKPISRVRVRGLVNALLTSMLSEQIGYTRLPFCAVVECSVNEKKFPAVSVDLSRSGMLLERATGLQQGATLQMEFELPNTGQVLKIRARVVRVANPDRVGVEFMSLSSKDRDLLYNYIRQRMKVQA